MISSMQPGPELSDSQMALYGGVDGYRMFQVLSDKMPRFIAHNLRAGQSFDQIVHDAMALRHDIAVKTSTVGAERFNILRKNADQSKAPGNYTTVGKYPYTTDLLRCNVMARCGGNRLNVEWTSLDNEQEYRIRTATIGGWKSILDHEDCSAHYICSYIGHFITNSCESLLSLKHHNGQLLADGRYFEKFKKSMELAKLGQDTPDLSLSFLETRFKRTNIAQRGVIWLVDAHTSHDLSDTPMVLMHPPIVACNAHWDLVKTAFNQALIANDTTDVHTRVGTFLYWWALAMPIDCGSDDVGKWIEAALYLRHGLTVPSGATVSKVDELAQATFTRGEFLTIYLGSFPAVINKPEDYNQLSQFLLCYEGKTPDGREFQLERYGRPYDGGYVVPCSAVSLADVLMSYGVSDDVSFEEECCNKYQKHAYLFDGSVESIPSANQFLHFIRENIATNDYSYNTTTSSGVCSSFSEQIVKLGLVNKKVFIKMDIEGAEYEAMIDIIKHNSNITGITVEIHFCKNYQVKKVIHLLNQLNSFFYLVHLHANNYAQHSTFQSDYVKGKIPRVIELSYINKLLLKDARIATNQSHPKLIDKANNPYVPDPRFMIDDKSSYPTDFTETMRKNQEVLYKKYLLRDGDNSNVWRDFLNQPCGVTRDKREQEVVMSLTSYPERMFELGTTWLAIESLLRQTEKPDRVVLNLFEGEFPERKLSWCIEQQIKRGLEINWCPVDHKVFLKFNPAREKYPESVIVALDDDNIYPNDHLETLLKAHNDHPDCIISPCVRVVPTVNGVVPPVRYWRFTYLHEELSRKTAMGPSFNLIPEGWAGILFPPHSLSDTFSKKELRESLCPKDDDLWGYAMAVENGTKVFKPVFHSPYIQILEALRSSKTIGNVIAANNRVLLDEYFNNVVSAGFLNNAGLTRLEIDYSKFLMNAVSHVPQNVLISRDTNTNMFDVPVDFRKGFSIIVPEGIYMNTKKALLRVCTAKLSDSFKLSFGAIHVVNFGQNSTHYTITRTDTNRIVLDKIITQRTKEIVIEDTNIERKDYVDYQIISNCCDQNGLVLLFNSVSLIQYNNCTNRNVDIGVLTNTRYGFQMYTHKQDGFVSENIRRVGDWEPDVAYTLQAFLKRGDTVIHLGGHVGFDDIIIGRAIGDSGKLFVFEPNPESYSLLVKNLKFNKLDKFAQAFPLGTSDKNSNGVLHFNYQNTGAGAMFPITSDTHSAEVQLVRLDDHLNDLSNVSMIFMDIRGSELATLRGAQKILERSPNCKILMEWDIPYLTGMNENIETYLDSVFAEGRRVFKLSWDVREQCTNYIPMSKEMLMSDKHCDILIFPPLR